MLRRTAAASRRQQPPRARRRATSPRRPFPSPAVSAGSAGSCPSCRSWGALYSGVCRGCYDFARRHEPGPCGTCRRGRPLKEGYCRNCCLQAALQAAGTARRAPDLGPADFAAVRWHQLSFAGVARMNRRPRLPRPDEGPVAARPQSPLGAAGTRRPRPVPPVPLPALDRRVGRLPRPRAGPGHRLPARRRPAAGTPASRRKPAGPWPSCSPPTSPARKSPGQPSIRHCGPAT